MEKKFIFKTVYFCCNKESFAGWSYLYSYPFQVPVNSFDQDLMKKFQRILTGGRSIIEKFRVNRVNWRNVLGSFNVFLKILKVLFGFNFEWLQFHH